MDFDTSSSDDEDGDESSFSLIDLMNILATAADFPHGVQFQVGNERFCAHRHFLVARAPGLAELAKNYPDNTAIPLPECITPFIFRFVLLFVYTGFLPPTEIFHTNAIDLLDAADRFSCQGLKLAAELQIVQSGISAENCEDMITLGDAKNCALLKERALLFAVKNCTSVWECSLGFREISVPLLFEFFTAFNRQAKGECPIDPNEEEEFGSLSVSVLRSLLAEKGQDVDGSKKVLINRLTNIRTDSL